MRTRSAELRKDITVGTAMKFPSCPRYGLQKTDRPARVMAMDEKIVDDARFALLAKVRQARMMSGEERIVAGMRLFAGVSERMKEGIRDERPTAGADEIHELLLQRLAKLRRLTKPGNALP